MIDLPQHGGCLCGDIRYQLIEARVTLYACHCTDCQRHSGAGFTLSLVVRSEGLRVVQGQTREYSQDLADGRRKRSNFCGRCSTRLWGPSRRPGLTILEAGTLDDPTCLRPVGHIWTRSAQPWVHIPEGALNFSEQPGEQGIAALVRAWSEQHSST